MWRFHIRQNLRSAFFLAVLVALVAVPVALWHANRSGLPDSWRAFIERELAQQGIHLRIAAIRYLPLQGIAASDVRIYADPDHTVELSRIGLLLLDIDKPQLAGGKVRLNKMQLANASVLIPADTADPDTEVLEFSRVNGTMLMPGGRVFELRNATAHVGGIDITVNARLIGYRATGGTGLPRENAAQRGKRREFIATITRELERWTFAEGRPPRAEIRIDGDMNDLNDVVSTFAIDVPSMALNHHSLRDVSIHGRLEGRLLVLDSILAADEQGRLSASADYDLVSRTGRFDVESSLEKSLLARAWFGFLTPDELIIGGRQSVTASGAFLLPAAAPPVFHSTGRVACESAMIKGVVFDRIEAAFSIRDREIMIRDARVERADGAAWGKAHIQWPLVRMALESTLPIPVYKPFFINQPLEQVIDTFTTGPTSTAHVMLEGGFDVGNPLSWAYQGQGRVGNVAYNGVPLVSAAAKFTLSHHELDFRDGVVEFDTGAYGQRVAHGGPSKVTASVASLRFINPDQMIHIRDIRGEFWVPPVLALFNKKLAADMEAYRFHRPPVLEAEGRIDLTPAGRTRFDIRFDTPAPAATDVLGERITFSRAAGRVLLRGERIEARDLRLAAFDGSANATIIHNAGRLGAEIAWTRMNLPAVAAAYGVSMEGGGTTTGRIEFSIRDNEIATLRGEGNCGFEGAHLFAVPIFGPLSPLISGILGDKRIGYERAKDAFLTFDIVDGILRSDDFRTTTTSITLTGDGAINFNDHTIDMTMRMNARGLLGIITLPLRPFAGLFQFRGTGPMRDPAWEHVVFTNPPEKQRRNLVDPPKARVVEEP